jgi:hypothetical protein
MKEKALLKRPKEGGAERISQEEVHKCTSTQHFVAPKLCNPGGTYECIKDT